MQFDSGRWAANVKRISERKTIDSVDVEQTLAVVRELKGLVGKWGVFDVTLAKIARAIVERRISPAKVGEIIETAILRRRLPVDNKHHVRNPGGFFVSAVKRTLTQNGCQWNSDKSEES